MRRLTRARQGYRAILPVAERLDIPTAAAQLPGKLEKFVAAPLAAEILKKTFVIAYARRDLDAPYPKAPSISRSRVIEREPNHKSNQNRPFDRAGHVHGRRLTVAQEIEMLVKAGGMIRTHQLVDVQISSSINPQPNGIIDRSKDSSSE